MQERLPGYKRFLEEYTSQYLLYGYRKPILGHFYATVLFQASKTFGGLTCEVGCSRTEDFPYYRFFDEPLIGVGGFRARTTHILKGLEATTTKMYTSPDILMGHIMDLVSEAITAGNKLIDETVQRVSKQYLIWQPIYEQWLQAEQQARPNESGLRYGNLIGEEVARRILHDCLRSGRFDSFLGPKKFRYRDSNFLNCHVYLLAKALAFVEPPEENEMKRIEIDPQQDPEKILFDPISAISGRAEQPDAVELSSEILKRVPEWAFVRSFAALEALYDAPTVSLDEVKARVKAPAKPVAATPVGVSLDELYGAVPATAPGGNLSGPPPGVAMGAALGAVSEPLQRPKLGKERTDPFETFLDYIEGRVAPPKQEADPFDFLGSQLGL